MAMSGGVDSSVTAAICHEAGYEVVGVSMRLYDASDQSACGSCCSPDDFDDARAVAGKMGFPYYVLNLADLFQKEVIGNFVDEYLKGRTPNPCIHCNNDLKFTALLDKAAQLECRYMATGHYARIERTDGRWGLFRGDDPTRDQSYFLFTMTQKQMDTVRFPIGAMAKTEVRAKAAELGLNVAEKAESREICFVPDDDYVAFLESKIPRIAREGKILNRRGEQLGTHQGVHRYTVGQRKGLGISNPTPLYVLQLRPGENIVVVGDEAELYSNGLYAAGMNWPPDTVPEAGTEVLVKIRYKHAGVPAKVYPDGAGGCEFRFEKPVKAVAPGQAAVAYVNDEVIGGGWIERALP